MIHMLSAFDLKPDEKPDAFRAAYAAFIDDLFKANLIVSSGPVGRRVSDTPMDTDETRSQEYFSVMSFRDRSQMDDAYAHIAKRLQPATKPHIDMYRRIANSVFLCWQDDCESRDQLPGGDSPASA